MPSAVLMIPPNINVRKAVVKIVQWPDGERKNPVGEVVDILGQSGDNDVEMNTI